MHIGDSTRRRDGGRRVDGLLVVGLGDSTTAGTPGFASPLEAPPDGRGDVESQYAHWLRRMHPEWRVLNHGVNGERTDQVRARLERDVIAIRPDVLVIIAGVNDIYQGLPSSHPRRELKAMYDGTRAAGIPLVIVGSILPYNTASPLQNRRARALNEWIQRTAREHAGMAFCDTRTAVAARGAPDRLASSPDGLHPSPEGYRLMAIALERTIAAAAAR